MYGDLNLMRQNMVNWQLLPNNITQPRLIKAYSELKRENFIASKDAMRAYVDEQHTVKEGRMLMRPLAMAKLIQLLELEPPMKVLDVAAGFGYSSCVLSYLVQSVVSLEIPELYPDLKERIDASELTNIVSVSGGLELGVPQEGPFDAIMIAHAVSHVPSALFDQLKIGGRLICCIAGGEMTQSAVTLFTKNAHGISSTQVDKLVAPMLIFNGQDTSHNEFTF